MPHNGCVDVLVTAVCEDSVVFPGATADRYKASSPNPKSSTGREDNTAKGTKPRFGFGTDGISTGFNFGVQPISGGISGSASFSSSYGGQGQGHSGSQSQSFNFQAGATGFSASQAASHSSSFNSQFPGYIGYDL
jgi:hypothetical protein